MSRCSNKVTMRERAWMNTCSYKTCYMRNVCKCIGAHFFGYSLECLEIKCPCIGACPDDYYFRPAFYCQFSYFIVINRPSFTANTIAHDIIEYAGKIYPAAMTQMSAMCKVHPHYRITRLKYSKIYGHISLCP